MFQEGIKCKFIWYFTVLLITLCIVQFIFILFYFKGFMKNWSILGKVESSLLRGEKKLFISESLTSAHPNFFYRICGLNSWLANDFKLNVFLLRSPCSQGLQPWAGACIASSKVAIPPSLFMSSLSFWN